MRPWVIRGSGDVRLSSDIKALLSNKREIIHIDGMDDTNGGQARSTVRECEKAVGGPLGQAMETERRVCCENTAAVQVHLKHRRAVRQDQSLLIRHENEPDSVSGSGVMHTALGIRTYQGYRTEERQVGKACDST